MQRPYLRDRRSRLGTCLLATVIATATACCGAPACAQEDTSWLAQIRSTETSLHDKASAFEEMAVAGGPESVATLAGLINDPKLSHYARYALQTNPDPSAGTALRDALDSVRGTQLIGVINSLGSRGDEKAIPALAKLCESDDEGVAVAAAGALVTIGSDAALAALSSTPPAKTAAFADPLLKAAIALAGNGGLEQAEGLLERIENSNPTTPVRQAVQLAGIRVAKPAEAKAMLAELLSSPADWRFVAGLQAAAQADSDRFAEEVAAAVAGSPAARQTRLLAVLENKPGDASLEAARTAVRSTNRRVRIAAVQALGAIGVASDGERLVRLAVDDAEMASAAKAALVRIGDPSLDDYLLELLDSPGANEKALAAEVAGLRRVKPATAKLLAMARRGRSESVRMAALSALRQVAPGWALDQVLDLAQAAQNRREEQLAEQAAVEVAQRVSEPQVAVSAIAERLDRWPAAKHGVLLDSLLRLGDDGALQLVSRAADYPERPTQDNATRVLGDWPSGNAAPVLLRVASSDHAFAVRALRGYLRIARQYNSGDERIAMCRRALEVASRDKERLLALETLALSPSVDSLSLAVAQLSSDALGPDAATTVMTIAEVVSTENPDDASDAAEAVIAAAADEELVSRARKLVKP